MKTIAIFLSLLCAAPAWGAVGYDTTTTATETGQDAGIGLTHTSTGANLVLLCAVHYSETVLTVTGVTHNGVALTQSALGKIATSTQQVDVWYLIAPATGAQAVVATLSGTGANKSLICSTFTGSHQSSPFGTGASFSGTGNPMTASITVPTNGMGVMFCTNGENGGTFTPGGSQTEVADFADTDNNHQSMASYTSSTGAVTMTFTNGTGNYGACIAIPINEAATTTRRAQSPMVFR